MSQNAESNLDRIVRNRCLAALKVAALALLLAGEAFAAAAAPQDLPASLRSVFTDGAEALKAGQLDVAEEAFLRVLREGGRRSFVYNNLGIVYQQRGDHAQAIAQFREAIRLQPSYLAPRILIGQSLLALGKVAEATRALEDAVKLQPREPLARLALGKAYERAEDFAGAVDQFRVLCELAPKEPEYTYQLGNAYLKLAGACFREILQLNPHSAWAYQTRAENYRAQGRLELAVRAFQRAAQADPALPGVHFALAQICLEQGKRAEARKELERELTIVPESAPAKALKEKLDREERSADSGKP